MNIQMQSYYQENMKKMDQYGEKAESVIRKESLFKALFMMEAGPRMVENMNGIRKMRFTSMRKSFISEFLLNIGDIFLWI